VIVPRYRKTLCDSIESLAEEVRKLKETSLGETDLDAIRHAKPEKNRKRTKRW